MPLSWNEIRNRAHEFSRRWADETPERAEAQSFWQKFFAVFGINRKRFAFLFALYQRYTSLLPATTKSKHGKR